MNVHGERSSTKSGNEPNVRRNSGQYSRAQCCLRAQTPGLAAILAGALIILYFG